MSLILEKKQQVGGKGIFPPEANRNEILGFVRFLIVRFGMKVPTAYQKIQTGRMKDWELKGVLSCIYNFDPNYKGNVETFYENTTKRRFWKYMKEHGMSSKTVIRRFRQSDFSDLERIGYLAAYAIYRSEQPN